MNVTVSRLDKDTGVRMVVMMTLITLAALSPTIGGYYPDLNMLNNVLLRFHPPLCPSSAAHYPSHSKVCQSLGGKIK